MVPFTEAVASVNSLQLLERAKTLANRGGVCYPGRNKTCKTDDTDGKIFAMQSGVYGEAANCQVYQAGLNTHLNVGQHLTRNTEPRVP